ncbi:MAG: SIS domain-containing protein [Candidatus Limnocylindrales bacterium]|jgi:glucosamine--fructose-6-phosphate aminotransferase (isomerizing)
MRSELGEAPEIVRSLIEKQRGVIDSLAEAIASRPVDMVLMAARGTSDHAAIYAQYIFGVYNKLPVALAAPSIQSLYGVAPRLRNALVIGVSQSGQSPDVVGVVEDARRQNALTVAVTNDVRSPLSRAAEFHIDIRAGRERAVAATKTYVAELTALAMLSTALQDDGVARGQLAEVPDAIAAALGLEGIVAAAAREQAGLQRAVVLGRGFNYATALEWSLKLKEMSYVLADAYSTADFEHGPIAMIDPGFVVHAIAADGPTLPEIEAVLGRLREAGARLVVASNSVDALAFADVPLRLPAAPEWLSPLSAIIPGQLFAYHLALAKHLDTERPRHIRKVTMTR